MHKVVLDRISSLTEMKTLLLNLLTWVKPDYE